MAKASPCRSTQRRSYGKNSTPRSVTTSTEYTGFEIAVRHFNRTLFDGRLPEDSIFVVLTRKPHSAGHFAPRRYAGRTGEFVRHELSLNPDQFCNRSDQQILQTLVHEMCHLEQETFGSPPSRGYHDRQFADLMKRVGLQPSNTGALGGKEVGQKMSDYPIPEGAFLKACDELAKTGFRLNLESARRPGSKAAPNSKTRFHCGQCGANAWGKRDLKISCTPCGVPMPAVVS